MTRPFSSLPGTVQWAIGLSWFHVALAAFFFFVALGNDHGGLAAFILVSGTFWVVVTVGLQRVRGWAWTAAVVLSLLSISIELAQLRVHFSTNLAVLVLLLTPSARSVYHGRQVDRPPGPSSRPYRG